MTAEDAIAEPVASSSPLRIGIAAAAGGFWFVSVPPVIVAGSEIHGLVVALWRSWLGFAILSAIVLPTRRFSWALMRSTAPSGICFGLATSLFFWASQLTSIANASLISVLQPVVLMIAAHFMFSELLARRDVVWSTLAIAGAIFLVFAADSTGTGDVRGDALAFVSTLAGAGYFVFAKRCLMTTGVAPFMFGMFFWGGVAIAPMALVTGEEIFVSSGDDWIRIVGIVVLSTMGHVLLNTSQGRAPLNLIGVLQLIVPVSATFMAYVFLDQSVSVAQAVGMALVMIALSAQALTSAVETRPTG